MITINRSTLTLALAATLCSLVQGQAPVAATVTRAASPVPAVTSAPVTTANATRVSPPAPGVAVVPGPTADPALPAPTGENQIVYTAQLPSVAEITSAATTRGLTVERVVQTGTEVVVSYRNASGLPSTVTYQNAAPGATPAPVTAPAEAGTVVVTSPPAVVYEQPAAVMYDDYPYYPRLRRPSLSLRFGLGRGHGGRHRGHRRH